MARYRIGLMAGNKSIDYVHQIRRGVQSVLDEEGHTLVAISDLIPFHSRIDTGEYYRVAFELTARLGLDVVIVPAGVIASFLSQEHAALGNLLETLDSSRTLIIEREIPGYRCIAKDNVSGMRECMRHLIEVHGFKEIAFIGGPSSSTGASEREEVYFEEMAAHGLATPKRLLAHGDLSGECGDEIDRLIDENPGLEAIVCCCDLIAYSVYNVMARRKLRVGVDIAVTGFDDQELSARIDPPLSTVRMTGYDLGCMAGREAIRMCQGLPQQEMVQPSVFVRRGSCGEDARGRIEQFHAMIGDGPFPSDEVVDELVESSLVMADAHTTEQFREAMRLLLKKVGRAHLLRKRHPEEDIQLFTSEDLAQLFHSEFEANLSPVGLQSAITALVTAFLEQGAEDDAAWSTRQIAKLNMYIARALSAKHQEFQHLVGERGWVFARLVDDALSKAVRPQEACEAILRDLSIAGVRTADLYALEEPIKFLGSHTFSLSDNLRPLGSLYEGRASGAAGGGRMPIRHLIDRLPACDEGASYVYTVGPLVAGDELVGVAAMDMGSLDEDGQLMAFLNLGVALKQLQIISDEAESSEILNSSDLLHKRRSYYDSLTGVLNRHGFMAELGRIFASSKGTSFALCYFDLVDLKGINESFGHDAGDRAVVQTMRLIRENLPNDALLGRFGGSKFVAFMHAEDGRAVAAFGRAVEAAAAEHNAAHEGSYLLSITYGGVVLPIGESSFQSVSTAMQLVDKRLYEMNRSHGRGFRYGGGTSMSEPSPRND